MATTVTDNTAHSRYELHVDGELGAFLQYQLRGDVTDLIHTETVAGFEGQGLASILVAGVLDDVRSQGRQIRPTCPYVRRYLSKHPEQHDLVPEGLRFLIDAQPG